jgi:hypothetical protein
MLKYFTLICKLILLYYIATNYNNQYMSKIQIWHYYR